MSRDVVLQPIIMSGGAGSRLWPLSRRAQPKQLLPLVTERTMIQETALRLRDDTAALLPPAAICGAAHADMIAQQLADVGAPAAAIITEPAPRNTAAVAAIAALWTKEHQPHALALLAPADHHIADAQAFRDALHAGAACAAAGHIVTFGIKPDHPHTGYGYIETGASLGADVFKVAAFREKPNRSTAENYLAGGGHFWNAGIFLFAPDAMIDAMKAHAPDILHSASKALERASSAGGVTHLERESFAACRADSVDYAVMEKTDRAAVVAPVDVGWNDIGAWTSVPAQHNQEQVCEIGCANTTIKTDGPFVAAIGLEDMIVVATADAVLVAPKERAQEVKDIVERLKADGRDDLL